MASGALALAALTGDAAYGWTPGEPPVDVPSRLNPFAPRAPHFPAKAKSVIFLFMDGGPSQVDTFDPKPRLDREHGQPIKVEGRSRRSSTTSATCCKCPWKFRQLRRRAASRSATCSRTSPRASTTWPIVRSMVSNFSEHTNANYFLHTGHGLQGRPSMGAWVTYGLGSECQNLPGFVVLNSGLIPPGGLRLLQQRLPAGDVPGLARSSRGAQPVADIAPGEATAEAADRQAGPARAGSTRPRRRAAGRRRRASKSAIANYELAFRMQTAVPELMDLAGETRGDPTALRPGRSAPTEIFGRAVPDRPAAGRARRALRRAALSRTSAHDRWDQHSNLQQGTRTTPGPSTSRSPACSRT